MTYDNKNYKYMFIYDKLGKDDLHHYLVQISLFTNRDEYVDKFLSYLPDKLYNIESSFICIFVFYKSQRDTDTG